jgi:hypothetical protein
VRRLWAVARTTLREAVRTRTAAVVLVVLVVVVGLGPFVLHGTGKLSERVQLVLSYSLSAVGFLLSILTIFLATSTLAGDLREKRIETIATKPIPRWQIVVGKWLGVMLLNLGLLAVSGVLCYVLVRDVVGRPSLAADDRDRQRLENEVYTARHTVDPTPPDFDAGIDKEIERLRSQNKMPEDLTEAQFRRRERVRFQTLYNSLPPGQARGRLFEGVRPARGDETLYLRFKVIAVGGAEAQSEDNTIGLRWVLTPTQSPTDPNLIIFEREFKIGDFVELPVPASVVSPQGVVYAACGNVDGRLVYAAFPGEEGVQLLYTAGTFEGNFVRALLLVLVRLAFLAALGLAAAALLSFPVASLFVMFVFICALSVSSFVSLSSPVPGTEEQVVEGTEREPVYVSPAFYRVVLRAVAAVVPDFGRYDGAVELATGKLVAWRLVGRGLVVVAALYGGVVMAAGCLYFSTRELADVE